MKSNSEFISAVCRRNAVDDATTSFMNDENDVDNDVNKDSKALNTLRVSFGANIFNGKSDSSAPINVEVSNSVFTDLSFSGYQVAVKSSSGYAT